MNIAIYARVSKDEADKNDNRYQNPENQLVAIRKYCDLKGHQIFGEYVDRRSGADPNRDQFRLMMQHASIRAVDAIIVWKLDRFSREPMYVVMGYINQLKTYKCGLISITESWLDTTEDNPVSELILSIMAWFSAEERRKISERTRLEIERKKAEGTYRGGQRGKDKRPRKTRKDKGQKRGAHEKTRLFIKQKLQNE